MKYGEKRTYEAEQLLNILKNNAESLLKCDLELLSIIMIDYINGPANKLPQGQQEAITTALRAIYKRFRASQWQQKPI